jgi:hypothetical protein
MIMHSAVNNKSSTTTLISGTGDNQSWVQDVFLNAVKPSTQEDWPNPLISYSSDDSAFTSQFGDMNAERRDPYRMTVNDLQQVVNIGTYLGADPTYMTEKWGGFFDFYNNFTPSAKTYFSSQTTPETFRYLLTNGYVGVISIGPVTVHVTPKWGPGYEEVTFTQDTGGHILAVQGFSSIGDYSQSACQYNSLTGKMRCTYAVDPDTETFTLSINDPWFANRRSVPITTLKAGANQQLVNGSPIGKVRYVEFPLNDDGTPTFQDSYGHAVTEMAIWPFNVTNTLTPIDVWSLSDGQTIELIATVAMISVP